MTSEAKKRANERYHSKTSRMCLRFSPDNMDAYLWLQTKKNKTAYIVDLIRKDMRENG